MYAIMRANYELYIYTYNTTITFYFVSRTHYDTSVAYYAMYVGNYCSPRFNFVSYILHLPFKIDYLCLIVNHGKRIVGDR